MKKVSSLFAVLALLATFAATADRTEAGGPKGALKVRGGGTGLFIDPSVTPTNMGLTTNFSVALTVNSDGSARGHFICLIPGTIVVNGTYSSASVDASTGIVTASGVATETFPGAGQITVNFTNTFKAGGVGVGQFTLTEDSGYFDVPPFHDTEVVVAGHITFN